MLDSELRPKPQQANLGKPNERSGGPRTGDRAGLKKSSRPFPGESPASVVDRSRTVMLSWRDPTLGCWKFNAYLRRSVQTCSAVLGGARGEAVPQHSGTDRKAQRVKIPLAQAKLACTNPNEEDTGYDSPGSGKDERNKFATPQIIRCERRDRKTIQADRGESRLTLG